MANNERNDTLKISGVEFLSCVLMDGVKREPCDPSDVGTGVFIFAFLLPERPSLCKIIWVHDYDYRADLLYSQWVNLEKIAKKFLEVY